ncbi:MAG: DNA-directed RNA polymerase subunit omega [Armatimonadetes bacterium]|nr:DNA-directed RNA polymerase subunit omega [Armatimonadota bacterium]
MSRYKDVYELADETGGMYALVVAAAKRAKQLREGRQPVVQADSSNPLTVAIQELLDGRVLVRPPGAVDEEPAPQTEIVEVSSRDLQVQIVEPEPEDEEAEPPDDPEAE